MVTITAAENLDECYDVEYMMRHDPDDEESVVFEKFMSGKHVTVGWYGNTYNGLYSLISILLRTFDLEVEPLDPDSETALAMRTHEYMLRW